MFRRSWSLAQVWGVGHVQCVSVSLGLHSIVEPLYLLVLPNVDCVKIIISQDVL